MPKFPNIGSIGPVRADGDATFGYELAVSATLAPAVVPESTIVFDGTTVFDSSVELLGPNSDRVSFRIRNSHAGGSAVLWINFGEAASVNASYPIYHGQEFVYNASESGRYTGSIYAIAPASAGGIAVFFIEETAA